MSGVRIPLPRPILSGSLAQLVEQLTFNQLVAGSNPARPTTFLNIVATSPRGSLAQLVEQLTFNQLVAGSNPARPTTSSKTPAQCRRFAFPLPMQRSLPVLESCIG